MCRTATWNVVGYFTTSLLWLNRVRCPNLSSARGSIKGAAILPSPFVCDSRHGYQNRAAHCKTAYEESADGLLRDDGIRVLRSGTRHNR
jgi:hypothetical protein